MPTTPTRERMVQVHLDVKLLGVTVESLPGELAHAIAEALKDNVPTEIDRHVSLWYTPEEYEELHALGIKAAAARRARRLAERERGVTLHAEDFECRITRQGFVECDVVRDDDGRIVSRKAARKGRRS